MPVLKNTRHERFARLIAEGWTAGDAIAEAGYVCASDRSAEEKGAKLLADRGIRERIEELHASTAGKGKRADITREELMRFYAGVVQAKPEDATASSPLAEMRMGREGPYYVLPDKLKAADSLARMMGLFEPEKVEHSVTDPLADLMKRLRDREG